MWYLCKSSINIISTRPIAMGIASVLFATELGSMCKNAMLTQYKAKCVDEILTTIPWIVYCSIRQVYTVHVYNNLIILNLLNIIMITTNIILLLFYRALSACEEKHSILIECYKTRLFGSCQGEMDSFWKCVNKNKVLDWYTMPTSYRALLSSCSGTIVYCLFERCSACEVGLAYENKLWLRIQCCNTIESCHWILPSLENLFKLINGFR